MCCSENKLWSWFCVLGGWGCEAGYSVWCFNKQLCVSEQLPARPSSDEQHQEDAERLSLLRCLGSSLQGQKCQTLDVKVTLPALSQSGRIWRGVLNSVVWMRRSVASRLQRSSRWCPGFTQRAQIKETSAPLSCSSSICAQRVRWRRL